MPIFEKWYKKLYRDYHTENYPEVYNENSLTQTHGIGIYFE